MISLSPSVHHLPATSSKDGVVKLWDLETQHCFQTIVGHRSEVWSLEIMKGETRLLTAAGEGGSIKVFNLQAPTSPIAVDQGQEPQDEKVIILYTCCRGASFLLWICRCLLLPWRWVM